MYTGKFKLRVRSRKDEYVIQLCRSGKWYTICSNDNDPITYATKNAAQQELKIKLAQLYNKLEIIQSEELT